MSDTNDHALISHFSNPIGLEDTLKKIASRIIEAGDKPHVDVKKQLMLLEQFKSFDLGKFLLQNRGLNGYWTHYVLMHSWLGRKTDLNNKGQPFSFLEDYILNRCPAVLATQERFEIFLQHNQAEVRENAKFLCIPCGMMGEFLYLDLKEINNISFFGLDYDPKALQDAENLAREKKLLKFIHLKQGDAWNLSFHDEFDLISSNGLNIYEPNADKIVALYKGFYDALKPGGKLVTSFLTYPPNVNQACEWEMSEINQEDLLLQKIIFQDILNVNFQNYTSSEAFIKQLENCGFTNIEIIYDKAKLFPTVLAFKKIT